MDKHVIITLPVGAWNVVLNALGARPFSEVADLMGEIKRQADIQVQQQEHSAPVEPEKPTRRASAKRK